MTREASSYLLAEILGLANRTTHFALLVTLFCNLLRI
jgi:hypothetical protein